MPKREAQMYEQLSEPKRQKPSRQLENAPPVSSLKDLVKMGNDITMYKNLNTVLLWRIAPYLEELENMVGMEKLKQSIFYQIVYYLQGMHTRNQNEEYLHTIIMGSPGTGKTTVAKIIGKIYQILGILSPSGKFRIAYRDDFIAEYLGQSAIKTRKLLKSCIGGVLFIDEVYSLAPRRNDKDSFSKEALDTLTAFLSEHKNDFCCIAAGYEEDIIECFFGMNRGLQRRFPWVHKIEPYSPEELADIFIKLLKELKWSTDMDKKSIIILIREHKKLFEFAGGDIETFISKCKMVHAKRVFGLEEDKKFILTADDINEGLELVKKNKEETKGDEPPPGMYL